MSISFNINTFITDPPSPEGWASLKDTVQTYNNWGSSRSNHYITNIPYYGDPPYIDHYGDPTYPERERRINPDIPWEPLPFSPISPPPKIHTDLLDELIKKRLEEELKKNEEIAKNKKVDTISDLTKTIEIAISRMIENKLKEILKEGLEVTIVKTKTGINVKVDSKNKVVQELLKSLPPITVDDINKVLGDKILEDDDE